MKDLLKLLFNKALFAGAAYLIDQGIVTLDGAHKLEAWASAIALGIASFVLSKLHLNQKVNLGAQAQAAVTNTPVQVGAGSAAAEKGLTHAANVTLPIALLLGFLCLSVTGCSTTVTTKGSGTNAVLVTNLTFLGATVTPTNVYDITRKVAQAAATQGIALDSDARPYLETTYQALNAFTGSTNYDTVQLRADLASIPISAINNTNAAQGIQLAVNALSIFSGLVDQKLDSINIYLLPAVLGFRDGLAVALGHAVSPQSIWSEPDTYDYISSHALQLTRVD